MLKTNGLYIRYIFIDNIHFFPFYIEKKKRNRIKIYNYFYLGLLDFEKY